MSYVLNALRALLLAALIWAVWHVTKRLDSTLADVSRFTQSATGVSADLRKIADSYRKQADAQAEAMTGATKNLSLVAQKGAVALDSLNGAIQKVSGAADNLNTRITTLGEQTTASAEQLHVTLEAVEPILKNVSLATQNIERLTADPNIPLSLANLKSTTGHVDATSADVQIAADLALVRFRQAMKPKSLALNIFEHLLGIASPAAQIATAAR